MDGEVKKIIF